MISAEKKNFLGGFSRPPSKFFYHKFPDRYTVNLCLCVCVTINGQQVSLMMFFCLMPITLIHACSDDVGVTWPELLDSHGLTLEVHHQGDCLVLLANIDTPFLNRGLGFFSH